MTEVVAYKLIISPPHTSVTRLFGKSLLHSLVFVLNSYLYQSILGGSIVGDL